MTPTQYAEQYWKLEVPFEDGALTVCVDRYRSGVHSSDVLRKASKSTVADKKGKETAFVNGRSIAVKTKSSSANTVVVVESTGGGKGLVSSRYSVLDVDDKTGVFLVQRGCSPGKLRVRVATLGV
jgi:hypothetical protein